jgi:hypothetical protein
MNASASLWNGGTYSTPLTDDAHDGLMVTYIAREGQGLPDVKLQD